MLNSSIITLGPVEIIALALLVLVALRLLWSRLWSRSRRIRLSGKRGSVYVYQDRDSPHLLKVGVTCRLSKQRKREVARTMAGGSPLRQVLALDMPHARTVETLAHRRLRPLRDRSGRGREWYRVTNDDELRHVLEQVEAAADEVRRVAMKRGRWNERDEQSARRWRLTQTGPQRQRLFGAEA